MFDPGIVGAWVFYADNSYVITRLLWLCGFMFDAPVHSHRTIELYLKTYLVGEDISIAKGSSAWGHELVALNNECGRICDEFNDPEYSRRIKYFQRYFDIVRYPSAPEEFFKKNEGGIGFSFDSCIEPLDEVVAFIRSKINLGSEKWSSTQLNRLYVSDEIKDKFKLKALINDNKHLEQIICGEERISKKVKFNDRFHFDLPGC